MSRAPCRQPSREVPALRASQITRLNVLIIAVFLLWELDVCELENVGSFKRRKVSSALIGMTFAIVRFGEVHATDYPRS